MSLHRIKCLSQSRIEKTLHFWHNTESNLKTFLFISTVVCRNMTRNNSLVGVLTSLKIQNWYNFFSKWMRYFEIAFFQMFLFWHKMPTKQVSIHSSWQLLCMNLNFPLFWDFVGRIVTIQASLFPINKKRKESLVTNFNRTSITYRYHTYIRLTHPDSRSALPDFYRTFHPI